MLKSTIQEPNLPTKLMTLAKLTAVHDQIHALISSLQSSASSSTLIFVRSI